ncbi:MAG: hypothetical protein ABR878_17670 [Roseiarcus sp.]|jgi:hypothetical protein
MTSYLIRSVSLQGIANLPKLLQTQGIKSREAGQPISGQALSDLKPTRLFSQALDISRDIAAALEERTAGVYFDWGPDSSRYLPHVEKRPPSPNAEDFLRLLGESAPTK